MVALATFARMYVQDLDSAIEALAASGVTGIRLRFGHAAGLQLALVGDVLVLAAPDEMLEPFRSTDLTVVDDLDQAIEQAQSGGATISREPADQAVGRNVTVAFPAGPVLEFVEWNQQTRAVAGV
ncbi:MAG: VOC family protein [Acidimicrobiales bacterium]